MVTVQILTNITAVNGNLSSRDECNIRNERRLTFPSHDRKGVKDDHVISARSLTFL